MRFCDSWKDYELIDCSDGNRLERWKDTILIRPDPQAIWKTPKINPLWQKANATYLRSSTGGGRWETHKSIEPLWQIKFQDLTFNIKTMGFKHTGIFPEQAVNWQMLKAAIKDSGRDDVKVLNLFAYTGGATVACLNAGAQVVHVDASKGMVGWAKENAKASNLSDKSVRWIVDDCIKFVEREIRRGNRYDIIVMDPPSYGRGPNGEIWKIEEKIYPFAELCSSLMDERSIMFVLNSYTTGLSPSVMDYILCSVLKKRLGGETFCDEIGLPVTETGLILPCGATSVWRR